MQRHFIHRVSQSGKDRLLTGPPHNTQRAGPHGAFPPSLKIGNKHPDSKAGYDNRPPSWLHLVRCNASPEAGAAPPCQRFGPSPCPTHYGGRLASMPSADFCPVTPAITRRRAMACVALRLCSLDRCAAIRSPGPCSPSGASWDLRNVVHRMPDRPPRIRT